MSTIIITDSRGAGLQQHLDRLDIIGGTTVLTHSGAGYEMAAIKSLSKIVETKPQIVIMLVGVCDLTCRNKSTKYTSLRYHTMEENVNHVINSAKSSYDLLKATGEFSLSYATITGIDLADYNYPARKYMDTIQYKQYTTTTKTHHPDQQTLNMSVLQINREITAINKKNNVPTTWVGGIVHAYFKNTNHHQYIRLYDGCHLNDNTKEAWAAQIGKSIKRISKYHQTQNVTN